MTTITTNVVNDNLIELGVGEGEAFVCRARVEKGPLLRTAMATAALFEGENGQTAEQVQIATLGAPLHGKYRVNDPMGPDRNGALIQYGQEFTYLDWNAAPVWHIYEFCTEAWTGPNTPILDGEGNTIPHEDPALAAQGYVQMELGPAFRRRGYEVNQANAIALAVQLAAEQGE